MGFACVDEFFVLPGDYVHDDQVVPGFDLTYVSGPILLGAAVLVLTACRLLSARPLAAYALLLLGSVLGATLLGQAAEFPLVQFLAPDVALYFVAATAPRRTSGRAAGMALTVLVIPLVVRLSGGGSINTAAQLAVALTVLVAWLLGNSARQSRRHAEQSRAQAAVQATTAERLRIARELHDVVAHTIGIVALQAGAARRVIDTQPARAREALGEVENAARETLSGLRRMLGALRRADAHDAPPHAAPSLSDVEGLAAATTAAGVRVVVQWHGRRRPLPPDIDLSAYRIVQESVTNVVRHAGARSCLVRVDHQDAELTLEITDTGRGPGGGGARAGYGLVGMRERVALLQGQFTAGARPEGGFRVAARLPLPRSAPYEKPTPVAS
ncbi:two-component sensor histidine kinase [Streptomyces dioscori]|uniref:histidine kinase n=2 Tax=Streptomyces dioscori TaxID=2109333 RepID=A0A2P8QGK0_9ACTN|nr:two-component sensor histidine kinase [Streptomyces dioscori]